MIQVLATFLRLLAVPWIASVTGLAILYQLVICWLTLPVPQFVVVCCSVLPLRLLATLVHEFGHAIAALWTKHTVMVISVFGVALQRSDLASPWRIRRTPPPYPPSCVVAFAQDLLALRRRDLIFTLGGVTMNALTAILCLGMAQLIFLPLDAVARFRSGPPGNIAFLFPNTLLIAALNLFAVINAFSMLGELVLTKPGTRPSDGTQLLHLLRGPHVERDIAIAHFCCRQQFGIPPLVGVPSHDWVPAQVRWAITMAEQGTASSWTSVDPGGAEAKQWPFQAIVDASRQAVDAQPDTPQPPPD